jgi:hypothetical protein
MTALKLITLWIVFVAGGVATAQDDRQTSAACGMVVHVLSESPTLDSFPAGFRSQIKKALSKDVAVEAKATGADQDGSDTVPLDKAFHLLKLMSSLPEKQLYVVWWYEQPICGAHGNCSMWLIEVSGSKVRNLVATGDAKNSSRTIGVGWGVGIRNNSMESYPDVMITAHGYRPPPEGGPETELDCRHYSGQKYASIGCPVDCSRLLNDF